MRLKLARIALISSSSSTIEISKPNFPLFSESKPFWDISFFSFLAMSDLILNFKLTTIEYYDYIDYLAMSR